MGMVVLCFCGFYSLDLRKLHSREYFTKRVNLRVGDLSKYNIKREVKGSTTVKDVIVEISEKMLGVTAVVENGKIIGVITDGDLRRMLIKEDNISKLTAADIMSLNPKKVREDAMAVSALEIMEENDITQLLVIDEKDNYAGIVPIHDLTKEGMI